MYKVRIYCVMSFCLLSGCQQIGVGRCLIENKGDVKQLGIYRDIRIDLTEFDQISVQNTINGLVFGKDESEVSYHVLASRRSLRVGEDKGKKPSIILYKYDGKVKIKTGVFFDIIESHFYRAPCEYSHDEPYCPKRFSISFVSDTENRNFPVISNSSFESVWKQISNETMKLTDRNGKGDVSGQMDK